MDLRTDEIPEAWTGKRVYVSLLVPTKGSAPASGTIKVGTLERVSVFGIVAVLSDPTTDEEPVHSFYPWSAILSITSEDDVADVINIR